MDGNRRYAESLGLHPNEGHVVGKSTLENLSEWCRNLNIRYLTVYAFSLENFGREEEELEALMHTGVVGCYLCQEALAISRKNTIC